MIDYNSLFLLTYKIITLLTGSFSIFLGYKLFCKGIFSDAGELSGKFGTNSIALKKAAPGTFFSLFGAIIICYAIFSGFHIKNREKNTKINSQKTELVADENLNIPKSDSVLTTLSKEDTIANKQEINELSKKQIDAERRINEKLKKVEKTVEELSVIMNDYDGDGTPDYIDLEDSTKVNNHKK